jgi:hypothetical protein
MNPKPAARLERARAILFLSLLLSAAIPRRLAAQGDSVTRPKPKPTLAVIVYCDDQRSFLAKVKVVPLGPVEGWPEGKAKLEFTTDERGRVFAALGPGKYRISGTVYGRLPAFAVVTIKSGQHTPIRIRLDSYQWDCAVVTCIL